MTFTTALLLIQAVASGAMCGIIWFVQAVHYPLFARIGGDERGFAGENQRRTGSVVIPFMFLEGATAAALAWAPPLNIPPLMAGAGLVAVVILWLSTAFVQMPLHARLAREGHAPDAVARLVRSNWLRTILWTLRAVLAAWMLHAAATGPSLSATDYRATALEALAAAAGARRNTPWPVGELVST
jgi:hypothetical protein